MNLRAKVKILLLLLIAVVLLQSCGWGLHGITAKFPSGKDANFPEVTILRDRGYWEFKGNLTLALDSQVIAYLSTKEFIRFRAQPGYHTLEVLGRAPGSPWNVLPQEAKEEVIWEMGREYFYRVQSHPENAVLSAISKEEALSLIEERIKYPFERLEKYVK